MLTPTEWFRPSLNSLHAYQVLPSAGMIKLDAMENPFSLPVEAQIGLAQALQNVAINRYPDPEQADFKDTLIQQGLASAHHAILLGNGSDEIIQTLHLSLREGSTVMALDPSFSMYELNARLLGINFVKVSLNEDFSLPTERLLAMIAEKKPTLLWIAYPNNPTGNTFNRHDLALIVKSHQGLCVIDEAYLPFTRGDTLIEWLNDHPHVLIMRTLSKLGLAGLRLGYLMGDHSILSTLEKIRLPFNTNRLSVIAAKFVLNHYHHALIEQARKIAQEREAMTDFFLQLSKSFPNLQWEVFPSKANFLLIRCAPYLQLFQWLLKNQILIKDMAKSSVLLHHCLRFTIGTADENRAVKEAITSFAQNLSSK